MKHSHELNTIVNIQEYRPEHQPWFEKFNRDWIERHFWMEPVDFHVLQHPDDHIIKQGGVILMASHNNEIAGTVALKFVKPGVYEFTKMAVDEKFRGLGIGRILSEVAIKKAKALKAHTIILYSSRKLETAIALYRKLGFLEVPVDGIYARADIKMRLVLDRGENATPLFSIRRATVKDAPLLNDLGRTTFTETFALQNTIEDMNLYLEQNYTIPKLEKEIEEPGSTFLIEFDDEREFGYAKLNKNNVIPQEIANANVFELERIYVSKAYHHKHAGHALLNACIELAKHQNGEVLWLGVWEHNVKAIAFYEKHGFEKFGSHPFVLGNDVQTDLLMKKNL